MYNLFAPAILEPPRATSALAILARPNVDYWSTSWASVGYAYTRVERTEMKRSEQIGRDLLSRMRAFRKPSAILGVENQV